MKLVLPGVLAFLLLANCSRKNIDTTDAVRQGVIRSMSKNVNVEAMDVNVVSVSFGGKQANAVVAFVPKGGTAQQGLTMNYKLERKDDEWQVVERAQSDLQKHAAQAGSGAMGTADGQAPPSELPPGHPPPGGAADGQRLPAGHPPLNGSR